MNAFNKLIIRKLIIFIVINFIFFASNSYAQTYYVDFNGGSDSNNGATMSTPFKHSPGDNNATNTATSTTLSAGDIVIFKGGVEYHGRIDLDWDGYSGNVITYDGNSSGSWGTGKAIFDGISGDGEYWSFFSGINSDYITIKNFAFRDKKAVLTAGCCATLRPGDCGNTGNQGALRFTDSTNIIVQDSTIDDYEHYEELCAIGANGQVCVDDVGIYFRHSTLNGDGSSNTMIIDNVEFSNLGRTAIAIIDVDDVTIKNSNFHDYISVAIRAGYGTDGLVIQDNLMHDMWQYEGDDSKVRCHAGDWIHIWGDNDAVMEANRDPHDIIIERNYFYNDKSFSYANGTANSFIEDDVYNMTWRNNLIINPHHMGISTQNIDQFYIYNNTFLSYAPIVSGGIFPLYFGPNAISNPTIEVYNNIMINKNISVVPCMYIHLSASNPSASNHNICYGVDQNRFVRIGPTNYSLSSWQGQSCGGSPCDTNSYEDNPNLASIPANGLTSSSGNYHPTSSSTNVKDTGIPLFSFSNDYDSNTRPQFSTWDIGAYEYENVPPNKINNLR